MNFVVTFKVTVQLTIYNFDSEWSNTTAYRNLYYTEFGLKQTICLHCYSNLYNTSSDNHPLMFTAHGFLKR